MKSPILNPAAGMRHPSLLVQVPRAFLDFYWHMPWPVVLDAAQAGRDGLSVWDTKDHNGGRPRVWFGPQDTTPADPPDVAFLAEGQHELVGATVLYQQNFTTIEGAQ